MTDKQRLERLRSFGFALLDAVDGSSLRVLASKDTRVSQELRAQEALDDLLESGLPAFDLAQHESSGPALIQGIMGRLDSVQSLSPLTDTDIELAHQVLDLILPHFDSELGPPADFDVDLDQDLAPKLVQDYIQRRSESPELRALEEAQVDSWLALAEGLPPLPQNSTAISKILANLPQATNSPDSSTETSPESSRLASARAGLRGNPARASKPSRSFKPGARPGTADARRTPRRPQRESAWPSIVALLAVGGFGLFLTSQIRNQPQRETLNPPVTRPADPNPDSSRDLEPGPLVPVDSGRPSQPSTPMDSQQDRQTDQVPSPLGPPADSDLPPGDEPILANDKRSSGNLNPVDPDLNDRPRDESEVHAGNKPASTQGREASDPELDTLLAGLTEEDLAIIRNRELLEVLDMLGSETGDRRVPGELKLGDLKDEDLDLVLNIELLQSLDEEDWE